MQDKVGRLRTILADSAPLAVAYSGGVDSTCLLAVAQRQLGGRVLGVIADSPSLPRAALREAIENARGFGASIEVVATREMENPDYVTNPPNRCYFCKAELFERLTALAAERGFAAIAYGENADDPPHLRPGSRAAREFSVLAPLRQAGLTKADVRELSRELGLPTADVPAQPCLSSRIPHGTPVTRGALAAVEQGEAAIRSLGFRVFRVRFLAGEPLPGARLEFHGDELDEARRRLDEIGDLLAVAGFGRVALDPRPYGSVRA